MKYFWREKNAKSCAGQAKIVEPTREELEQELILKVEQKLSRIDVVFDPKAREQYYLTDKKPKKNLDGLSEKEIVGLLGKRVAVDFLQLCFDLADFYGLNKNFVTKPEKVTVEELKIKVKSVVENLQNGRKGEKKMQVEKLFGCARDMASLCDTSWEDVETLQAEKEVEEGSFYQGKYVIFE